LLTHRFQGAHNKKKEKHKEGMDVVEAQEKPKEKEVAVPGGQKTS
jgi:hypothetical protein